MKKLIAITCAFLLIAQPALAAITVVDNGTVASNNDEPYDVTNVTVSGAHTYIACFVGMARTTFSVTSVTWDTAGANQALELIPDTLGENTGRADGSWYGLANPTAGTNKSVTVDISTTGAGLSTHCLTFSGVDQTAPVSGGTASAVDGASATINVTCAAGDLVVAGLVATNEEGATNFTVGASETQETTKTLTTRGVGDEDIHMLLISEAGAATTTINPSWTNATDNVLSGFCLKASRRSPAPPIIF